ncbi:hypothetical protein ZWY2020_023986 [Hordeum vulgare]|nr:hypothetical protein ZWY2020_023986 [Hordeum vulgare]
MCYGVYLAAKKLKQYFQEHAVTVVSTTPLSEIMGNRDATGRIAKWSITMADHDIRLHALAGALRWLKDADETGSRHRLDVSERDQLKYALQIHFAASNNVAEYEALAHDLRLAKEIGIRRLLCFDDSDLVVHQVSGEWDARDANMASYRFLI